MEELEGEQLVPEHLITLLTQPAAQPLGGGEAVQGSPIADCQAAGRMQQVAHTRDPGQPPKAQHGPNRSPGIETSIQVETHASGAPLQLIGKIQLSQNLEESRVAEAVKVVVALQLHAGEVETGRHPSQAIIGFEQHRPVSEAGEFVGHGQPHGTAAHHGDRWLLGSRGAHQKGISTALKRGS